MSDVIGTTTDKGGAVDAGGCLAATTLGGGTTTDDDAAGYGIDLLQYANLDASDIPNVANVTETTGHDAGAVCGRTQDNR